VEEYGRQLQTRSLQKEDPEEMKLILLALLVVSLSGCSLIPKRVELGQDRVRPFPVAKASEIETQRQAAQRAATKSRELLVAAVDENASPRVVEPAQEVTVLTESISRSLGPPLRSAPVDQTSLELSRRLDAALAKLNQRLDSFKEDNDKNAGKKIEGTGFLQIPYFVWLGGVVLLSFVGLIILGVLWTFLKMYALSNPPLALGLNAVATGGKVAAKAVSQLVAGGEKFKSWLQTEVPEISDSLRTKIVDLFHSAHKESQDTTVQQAIDELRK
jgi:hypothetical protein